MPGIDEHWNLFYGPEAGPFLKEFHRLLKKNFIEYCVPSDEAVPSYPPAEIDKMEKMLKEAEKFWNRIPSKCAASAILPRHG